MIMFEAVINDVDGSDRNGVMRYDDMIVNDDD